eukprot:364514-Chlamydomonas_euryale.AAC.8
MSYVYEQKRTGKIRCRGRPALRGKFLPSSPPHFPLLPLPLDAKPGHANPRLRLQAQPSVLLVHCAVLARHAVEEIAAVKLHAGRRRQHLWCDVVWQCGIGGGGGRRHKGREEVAPLQSRMPGAVVRCRGTQWSGGTGGGGAQVPAAAPTADGGRSPASSAVAARTTDGRCGRTRYLQWKGGGHICRGRGGAGDN